VEADIHLVDGELLVAHDGDKVQPGRTLETLYLAPLRRRVRDGGGRVYSRGPAFALLIDIKSEAESTYGVLRPLLAEYTDILTTVREGQVHPRAVMVVISGNRPREILSAETLRYAGLDGRLSDLDASEPSHLLPWISDNWRVHFHWNGEGPMPEVERARLREIVSRAHARGRQVRFWATPESRAVWQEFHAAGVDRINTDDLAGLSQFLRDVPANHANGLE
jgi:hypothetical protein